MNTHIWPTFYIYRLFYPLYKKGGLGGPKQFHHEFLAFFGHFGHQNSLFFKARTHFKTIFVN